MKKRLNGIGFACEWKISDRCEGIPIDERIAEIKNASEVLRDLEEDIKNRDASIRTRIEKYKESAETLEKKIKVLEKGIMYYPEEATFVRDCINMGLKEQNKKPEARLLCELLYMTDDSWQDAVESYLNTQRFHIIVSPENYLEAKKIYISLGDKANRIGLIDTRKVRDTKNESEGVSYLGDKIESENIYAKRYARFVMKNVICCDGADVLEEYDRSVTKDRLRFQNYCLQRMEKKEHYIGVDAITKQLKAAREELIRIQEIISDSNKEKAVFNVAYNEYTRFTAGNSFLQMEAYCDSARQAEELGIRMEEIKERIEEFKKNPLLLAMYDRVSECEKNLAQIGEKITDKKAEVQNLKEKLKDARQSIIELEENAGELERDYEDSIKKYPQYSSDVVKKYQDEKKKKSPKAIVNYYENRAAQDNIAYESYLNQKLIPSQRQYTSTYACDYPEGIEGSTRYSEEYLSLKNIELERHREALTQAQIRCKDRFRKEVLFRMKDDILRAKQQFKQINRVMQNLEYGEENYHFAIDKSRDKELGMFYDIIMDKDNQQIEQEAELLNMIADANKSEIFESQIEDFMSRIMIDVEEHAKENLTGQKSDAKSMGMYVDYRTYLDYDIIVKNSATGLEVPLSKVSGEGSGGENQAPFYVAICASLLQIYEKNPDGCMRLVILDEAFNKMTSDRIEPMMNMFKNLNLQVVLITTEDKATSIVPYCDITYAIVKSGNRCAITSYERI